MFNERMSNLEKYHLGESSIQSLVKIEKMKKKIENLKRLFLTIY